MSKALKARQAQQENGKKWARGLDTSRRAQFIDEGVLGSYDWRDWFPGGKPDPAFSRAAFDEAQYLEEIEGG